MSIDARRWTVIAGYAVSAALHVALLAALVTARPAGVRRAEPVEVEIVEHERPAPPPEPAPPPPPPKVEVAPPPPQPAPVRTHRQPPRRTKPPPAQVRPPPAAEAPPPPPRQEPAPPPPNSTPAAGDEKPGPVRFGVSMSSTTTAGTTAAPVGNSLYGSPAESGEDPATSRPYRAERYSPPTQVATLPSCACEVPRSEYPAQAAREGREGQVKLRLLVSAEGVVQEATVLSDPGFGFGAAAARSAKRFCRCKPATRGGQAVATELSPFTFTFELP